MLAESRGYGDERYAERGLRDDRATADPGDSYYEGRYRGSSTPFRYPDGTGNLSAESWRITGPHAGRGPKGYQRSDQQICEDVCERLERHGDVDASDIEVSVENGVITLAGAVPDRQMKRRAEECAETVYGARDVMNRLRVEGVGR